MLTAALIDRSAFKKGFNFFQSLAFRLGEEPSWGHKANNSGSGEPKEYRRISILANGGKKMAANGRPSNVLENENRVCITSLGNVIQPKTEEHSDQGGCCDSAS